MAAMMHEIELPSNDETTSVALSDSASSSDGLTPRRGRCSSTASTTGSIKRDTDDSLSFASIAHTKSGPDESLPNALSKSARRRQRRQILHKVIETAKTEAALSCAGTCDSASAPPLQMAALTEAPNYLPAFRTARPPAIAVSAGGCMSPPTTPPSSQAFGLLGTSPVNCNPCEASARMAPHRAGMSASASSLQSNLQPARVMSSVPARDVMFVTLSPASVDRYQPVVGRQTQMLNRVACPAHYVQSFAFAPAELSSVMKDLSSQVAEPTAAARVQAASQSMTIQAPLSPVNVVAGFSSYGVVQPRSRPVSRSIPPQISLSTSGTPSNDCIGLGVTPHSILASILSPDAAVARSLVGDGRLLAEQLYAASQDLVYED